MSEARDRELPSGSVFTGDRAVIVAALTGVTLVAWAYLAHMAHGPGEMAGMAVSAMPHAWSAAELGAMLAMWSAMMLGMMLPGAAPMILTFATINRRKRGRGQPFVPASVFAAGYLLVWGLFSLAATLAQWGLETAALLSPRMATASPVLGGVLFIAAGAYQFTPLKHACLAKCRSPFAFLVNRWRDGASGAARMGIEHGLYCLGCCWMIMALLFVGGVMNLLWVAALAGLVFVEKLLPFGVWAGRAGGVLMVAFGAYLLTPT